MRQRNISGYPLAVRPLPAEPDEVAADPFEIGPGEVVDWPELLAGCTPETEQPEPDAPVKRRKSSPAAAGDTEEDRP